MKKIEQGFDVNGIKCWFVLIDANLIGIYYSLNDAEKV